MVTSYSSPEDELLHAAAKEGDISRVQEFLLLGRATISVDARCKHLYGGHTVLHEACISQHLDVAEFLIKNGADINAKETPRGYTPLHWACLRKQFDLINMLIEHGADVNVHASTNHMRYTPLHHACGRFRDLEVAKLLIENGANVHAKCNYGHTPLIEACKIGHLEIIKLLVENGADVNAETDYGTFPVDSTIRYIDRNRKPFLFLVDNGAKLRGFFRTTLMHSIVD